MLPRRVDAQAIRTYGGGRRLPCRLRSERPRRPPEPIYFLSLARVAPRRGTVREAIPAVLRKTIGRPRAFQQPELYVRKGVELRFDAERAGHSYERRHEAVDMRFGMRRRAGDAKQVLGGRRPQNGINIDSLLKKGFAEPAQIHLFADHDGNNGGFARQN